MNTITLTGTFVFMSNIPAANSKVTLTLKNTKVFSTVDVLAIRTPMTITLDNLGNVPEGTELPIPSLPNQWADYNIRFPDGRNIDFVVGPNDGDSIDIAELFSRSGYSYVISLFNTNGFVTNPRCLDGVYIIPVNNELNIFGSLEFCNSDSQVILNQGSLIRIIPDN